MPYLIDTNILIRSKNDMPFDLWPTFWDKFHGLMMNGQIYSCDRVKSEIENRNDDLTHWMSENTPPNFYIGEDTDVMIELAATQNWANSNSVFTGAARIDYASKADAYIVATAKAKGLTVVTYEKSSPFRQTRVMIPDACAALGVNCCDLNAMLREMGVTI